MADVQVKTANICNITSSTLLNSNAGGSGTYISDNNISVYMSGTATWSGTYCQYTNDYAVVDDYYTISFTPICATNSTLQIEVAGTAKKITFTSGVRTSVTIQASSTSRYVAFYGGDTVEKTVTIKDIQIEKGDTATPYHPYSATGWVHSLRKLGTAADNITSFPATIYGVGEASTDWELEGNTVQNGTPSPQNIVVPQGCGEKTENLFGGFVSGVAINTETGAEVPSGSGFTSNFIPVEDNSIYSYSGGSDTISTCFFAYDNAKAYIGRSVNVAISATSIKTVTTASSGYTVFANSLTGNTNPIAYIRVCHLSGTPAAVESENIMLNTGSTAKPYEPDGYKLTFTDGQVTSNVYLGAVQSTRQIKKHEFDGTENWAMPDDNSSPFLTTNTFRDSPVLGNSPLYCSHFPNDTTGMTNGGSWWFRAYGYTSVSSDLATWKTWLQQQYAAGTPVIVWYVLATAETGIVNEPLHKIVNYADSITQIQAGTAIQLSDGKSISDIDSAVKPSKLSLTYKGWHNAYLKEKSENLFDYTTMSSGLTGYYLDSSGNEVSNNTWNITDYIPCDGQAFTLGKIGGNAPAICLYDSDKSYITGQTYNTGGASTKSDITVTATQIAKYIRFSYLNSAGGSAADDLSTIMLNSGQTALPYEPFWK